MIDLRNRLDERRRDDKLAEIERRGRAAFLEGAEERSRTVEGRPLTADELERVTRSLPLTLSRGYAGQRLLIRRVTACARFGSRACEERQKPCVNALGYRRDARRGLMAERRGVADDDAIRVPRNRLDQLCRRQRQLDERHAQGRPCRTAHVHAARIARAMRIHRDPPRQRAGAKDADASGSKSLPRGWSLPRSAPSRGSWVARGTTREPSIRRT